MMASATIQRSSGARTAALLIACGFVAVLLGLLGAIGGWAIEAFALTLLVPVVLLLADYRLGLIMLTVLMPFAASPLLPKAGPLSVINLLLAGVCGMYLLRAVLGTMLHKPLQLPLPRELLLYYVLPVTLACVVGTFHLREIPQHFLMVSKLDAYTLKDYWVSQYFKNMLLVLTACITGAAVVERGGKGLRFALAITVSAVLFVAAMVVLIGVTGMSLERLKDARSFLGMLGRHNNEAGVMLTTALGPMLFMQGYVKNAVGRWVLLVASAVVIGGIVLTFSRGAFLGLVAILLVYVMHFRRLKTAFIVVTLLVLAAAFAPPAVYERLGRGLESNRAVANLNSENEELTAGRIYTWEQLSGEVLRSPLWGRGQLSTIWSDHAKNSFYSASHPHNMYLEVLMDMGLLGAAAMFLFYRHVWRSFRRLAADPRLPGAMRGFFVGAWAGLLSMLIYGASNGHYYPAPEQVFFWVAVGLAFGYTKWLRSQPAAPVQVAEAPATGRRAFRVPADRILQPRRSPSHRRLGA
jgi:O-antigen ligase